MDDHERELNILLHGDRHLRAAVARYRQIYIEILDSRDDLPETVAKMAEELRGRREWAERAKLSIERGMEARADMAEENLRLLVDRNAAVKTLRMALHTIAKQRAEVARYREAYCSREGPVRIFSGVDWASGEPSVVETTVDADGNIVSFRQLGKSEQ
jgi:hypothetical protein